MGLQNLLQDPFGVGNVVRVRNPEDHVDTAFLLGGDILDHVAPDLVVGDHECPMVQGQDGCRHQGHIVDFAGSACNLDQIAHIVGSVEQDHHARREISESVLKGETDDKADNTEAGEQRTHLEAELRQGHQDAEDHDCRTGDG